MEKDISNRFLYERKLQQRKGQRTRMRKYIHNLKVKHDAFRSINFNGFQSNSKREYKVNSNRNARTASRGHSNHSELAAHDGDTEYDDERTNTRCARGHLDQFRGPVRGNDPSSCRRSEQLSRSLSGPPRAGRGCFSG